MRLALIGRTVRQGYGWWPGRRRRGMSVRRVARARSGMSAILLAAARSGRTWCGAGLIVEGAVPAAEFKAAVKSCRDELKVREFTLVSSGGYRLVPIAIQARLGRPRWTTGDPPYDWELHFGGPSATWARGGLDDVVFTYYQGHQQPVGGYYTVDTVDGVQRFLDDFRRRTLSIIDSSKSPRDLIDLLVRRDVAPLGGFGKANRNNQDAFAVAILRIATAYGIREQSVNTVIELLRPELDESPQRRAAALELAEREGLELE